jgi:DNA-binding MarR family transcriptional regulator
MSLTGRERLADAVAESTGALVAIAIRSVASGLADVTVAQHRVLVLLDQHGELTVNAVAESLGVNQSNASRHCTRLARLGLISRTRAPHDGRAVVVGLTPAGRRQVRVVQDARRNEIKRVLNGLPDKTVREVARAFEVFHQAAADTVQGSQQI